ncbi:MAG: gliding motility-associated C-terminal domain-containing protein [Crocinitomicaceae bacterium]
MMYYRILLLSFFCFTFLSNDGFAQCITNSVQPLPDSVLVCENDSGTTNFNAFGACTGNWEYQVTQGATVVQAWSTNATFTASPTVTTDYTVFARCSFCPASVAQENFTFEVLEEPTVTGNTFICTNSSTTLTASGSTGSYQWYDAATGGNLIGSSPSITTGPLTQDTTLYVSVQGSVTSSTLGSVLITECGLGGFPGASSADYLELSNLYSVNVNTTGWVAAVSSSYGTINSVNGTIWNLPSQFTPCSILSRTDVSSQPNYWGSNILWNPGNNGWAIIIDDAGNVVDFVAWGWTNAQLAGFNPTINGFSITLGSEWIGNSFPSACGSNGTGNPFSISRIGTVDNNNASDFVCQATSLNVVNPSLNCGWSASADCRFPTTITVDVPPTASNPATINVECIGDVPAPDVTVVIDEADDFPTIPTVTFESDVSDGLSCPETITRTYRVTDVCGNFIDVQQLIVVMDITPPIAGTPASINVECFGDIPAPDGTVVPGISDNCAAVPTVTFISDASDGLSCPETVTRTYAVTDDCGNQSTVDQTIVVNDITPPTASNPLTVSYPLITDVPAGNLSVDAVTDEADNCTASPTVTWVGDVSDNDTCVGETITRTFSVIDDCGNEIFVDQLISIDPVPLPIDAGPDQTVCVGDLVTLSPINPAGASLTWNPAFASGPFVPAGTATYTVTAVLGACIATDDVTITVEDPPIVSFYGDVLTGCQGHEVTFTNTSTAASGLANCDWTMDGQTVNGCGSVTYSFPNGGTYDVTLTTTSVTGCVTTETYSDYVYIEATPEASFGVSNGQLTVLETGVDFFNTSTGAVSYEWNFDDDSGTFYDEDMWHEFPTDDGGSYNVQLIAISPIGCPDTTWGAINIDVELLYFIPNTFTPDYDAFNQYFKPVFTSGFDPFDYNLKIFNRWGEVIWESNDATVGWDGTYNGKLVQVGTYAWKIEFKTSNSDERKMINGHVNVLK